LSVRRKVGCHMVAVDISYARAKAVRAFCRKKLTGMTQSTHSNGLGLPLWFQDREEIIGVRPVCPQIFQDREEIIGVRPVCPQISCQVGASFSPGGTARVVGSFFPPPARHLRRAGQPNLTSGSTRAQPLPVAESPHHQLSNQPRNRDRSRQLNRTRIMARMRKR